MPIEFWIAVAIIAVIWLWSAGHGPVEIAKQAGAAHNRGTLINELFSRADKAGGFWQIDLTGDGSSELTGVTIRPRSGMAVRLTFAEMGYENINVFTNWKFLNELSKETAQRGGLYSTDTRTSGGWTGGFTSHDGGNSYDADYDTSTCITAVHLYAKNHPVAQAARRAAAQPKPKPLRKV